MSNVKEINVIGFKKLIQFQRRLKSEMKRTVKE